MRPSSARPHRTLASVFICGRRGHVWFHLDGPPLEHLAFVAGERRDGLGAGDAVAGEVAADGLQCGDTLAGHERPIDPRHQRGRAISDQEVQVARAAQVWRCACRPHAPARTQELLELCRNDGSGTAPPPAASSTSRTVDRGDRHGTRATRCHGATSRRHAVRGENVAGPKGHVASASRSGQLIVIRRVNDGLDDELGARRRRPAKKSKASPPALDGTASARTGINRKLWIEVLMRSVTYPPV
jgi:hypothetical protein